MYSVALSQAVRSNLLSLQNTATLLDTTQTRLATGNKVNSALDNPTSYFTAASLNSRASDLGNLLDSVSNAVQTIQAANDGITSITRLVQAAQATASQAQQLSETVAIGTGKLTAGAFSTLDVTAGSTTLATGSISFGNYSNIDLSTGSISFDIKFDGLITPSPIVMDAAWITTNYNPVAAPADKVNDVSNMSLTDFKNVLNVMESVWTGAQTFGASGGHLTLDAYAAGSAHSIELLNLTETGITGTTGLSNQGPVSGTDNSAGAAVTFNLNVDGAGNQPISISSAAVSTYNGSHSAINAASLSATDVAALINSQVGSTIASVVSGALVFTSPTSGGSSSVAITGFHSNGATGSTGIANASNSGASVTGPNPARAALITQYNGLLDQIDQLSKDAGYNGNNLLSGTSTSLKVIFNETGTSTLTIAGKDASAAGLGLSRLTLGTEFNTNTWITTILGNLKSATDALRADASAFGSNLSIVQVLQDFTKALINTLQTGAANLTLADSNEEAASLLALQTRQSLSTKALSLASQSDQNVLRLLQ